MNQNQIKLRHLVFALRRSLDPLVIGVIFLGIMAATRRAPLSHYAQAFIPFVLISLGCFGYHLWKVMRDR